MRFELPTKTFQNQRTRIAYGFNGSAKISDIAELFPERDDPLVTISPTDSLPK